MLKESEHHPQARIPDQCAAALPDFFEEVQKPSWTQTVRLANQER